MERTNPLYLHHHSLKLHAFCLSVFLFSAVQFHFSAQKMTCPFLCLIFYEQGTSSRWFFFPLQWKRVSHIVLCFMVCVKNCRRRFGSRINPDPDNITLSSGLKPVPGFERMPPSLCLRDRGLDGSKGAGYDDSAAADQLINYSHAGMKNKKKSLLIYIWRKRSASWTLTAAADYSHRRTDTSSGSALNLSKCKLVVLRHKSPHCPSFER